MDRRGQFNRSSGSSSGNTGNSIHRHKNRLPTMDVGEDDLLKQEFLQDMSQQAQQGMLLAQAEIEKYRGERDKAVEELSRAMQIIEQMGTENLQLKKLLADRNLETAFEASGRFLESIPGQLMSTAEHPDGFANERAPRTQDTQEPCAESGLTMQAMQAKIKEIEDDNRKMEERMSDMRAQLEIYEAVISGFYHSFKSVSEVTTKSLQTMDARMSVLGGTLVHQDEIGANLFGAENKSSSKKSEGGETKNVISQAVLQAVISSISPEELAELESMECITSGKDGK